jgi:hypothetical protein
MIENLTVQHLHAMLRAALHKGTPRPHRTAPSAPPAALAARDAAARAERLERADTAPGEHPAPLHVDVLDLLGEADHLPDEQRAVDDWRRRAAAALGLILDGQLLDALCPWCDGRTDRHPTGGARTLRVHVLHRRDQPDTPVVACEGGHCQPSSADASGDPADRWHGHPTWPQHEWEWLAARIDHAEQARMRADAQARRMTTAEHDHALCRCGYPLPNTPGPGRPAGYCSDRCRLDAHAARERTRRARDHRAGCAA